LTDLLNDADIDFDHAASAFPEISLDGEGDFPAFSSPLPASNIPTIGPFDLDAFGSPAPPARSKAHRQETISKAERSIVQFYEEHTGKRERQIAKTSVSFRDFTSFPCLLMTFENRYSEVEYVASQTNVLSRGTTWDRISDLVELQNSQSKTPTRSGQGTICLG
jgi:hypothetical protein